MSDLNEGMQIISLSNNAARRRILLYGLALSSNRALIVLIVHTLQERNRVYLILQKLCVCNPSLDTLNYIFLILYLQNE